MTGAVPRRRARAVTGLVAGAAIVALALPAAAVNPGLDDIVRIGAITYVAQESAETARWPEPIGTTLLGEEVARVTCALRARRLCGGHVVSATVLPPGTAVHAVKGYRQAFRVAARRDGELVLYEAWENRRAQRGVDLYDLAGKVAAIELIREDRTTSAALRRSFANPDGVRIDDPQAIARFVDFVLAAPTVPAGQRPATNPKVRYWLTFRFADGTATGRAYDPDSGQLARGLVLPAEFRTLVEDAVNFTERK